MKKQPITKSQAFLDAAAVIIQNISNKIESLRGSRDNGALLNYPKELIEEYDNSSLNVNDIEKLLNMINSLNNADHILSDIFHEKF